MMQPARDLLESADQIARDLDAKGFNLAANVIRELMAKAISAQMRREEALAERDAWMKRTAQIIDKWTDD